MSQPGEEPKGDRFKIRGFFEELGSRAKNNWVAGFICALLIATIGYIFSNPLGVFFDHWSYDLPFRMRGVDYPTEAAVVYLDEQSYTDLKQHYGEPWDRGLHARLLDKLTQERAQGVVFDIVLTEPLTNTAENLAKNDALVRAITNNGKVILAADLRPADISSATSTEMKFDPPFDPFYSAVGDDRIGSDAVWPDSDQEIRRYLPIYTNNDIFASEAWAAATMIDAPVTRNVTNKYLPFYINYYGPAGQSVIPGVSYSKVLSNEVPTNIFTGKMVFVGEHLHTQFGGTRKDEYPTPFSYLTPYSPFTGGVEINATAFLNLVRGDMLKRASAALEIPFFIAGGAMLGFFMTLLRPLAAALTSVFLAGATVAIDYVLFTRYHTWFSWCVPVFTQLPVALVYSISVNSVQLYVEKQKVEQSLALYLSPKLVKQFAKNPKLLKPGAEKQLLTILFSDIAGFTTISEGMDSDDLAKAMNMYFQSAVQNCIFSTDGTVVKYIGDAIFAFWNAPEVQGDHSYRACEAALRFRDQPKQFMNNKELVTRIGLHTGVANVGNFGSMTRVDYTALGENINLASRMEGLNKYLGTRVLITEETQKVAGPKIVTRYLGMFRLKGFEKAVGVYELTGRIEEEAQTHELRARFAEAVAVFTTRNFDAAEAAFRHVLEIAPHDGPTEFYLGQVEELRHEGLPSDWKGEITLKDK